MDNHKFHIPVRVVEAESEAPPPRAAFRSRPAEEFAVGDLLLMDGEVLRIIDRKTYTSSIEIRFTVNPVLGGHRFQFIVNPRQWFPIVKGAPTDHAQSDT